MVPELRARSNPSNARYGPNKNNNDDNDDNNKMLLIELWSSAAFRLKFCRVQ